MLKERVDLFEFKKEERKFLVNACKNMEEVISHTSVYAGSSDDVEHGILIGNDIVFIDTHTPEINLASIKDKLNSVSDSVSLEEIDRSFPAWKFEALILGERVELEYWCADATKVLPDEMGVYFIKVPLPKEPNAGCLCSEENLFRALSKIVIGGYYLERECPIEPKRYGFRHILSGEMSGLSIRSAKGNLYKKINPF